MSDPALELDRAGAVDLPEQTEELQAEATETAALLNNAETIELKKKFRVVGEHWSIKVDGKEVATVEGVYVRLLGETISILSPNLGVVASAEEQILNLSHTARFYDAAGDETGELTKKVLSLLATYTLRNTEGRTKATLKQKTGVMFKGEILDDNGKQVWRFDSDLSVLTNMTLHRVAVDSNVSALDAIRMAVVASIVHSSS